MTTRIENTLKKAGLLTEENLSLVEFTFNSRSFEFKFIEGDYSADWEKEEQRQADYAKVEQAIINASPWGGFMTGHGSWLMKKGYKTQRSFNIR